MHYEYTVHVNNCFASLQYYTTTQNILTPSHEKCTTHTTPNNRNHNIYGSAVTAWYHSKGTISYIAYYINNKLHNEHKPALTYYHSNGTISRIEYYINSKLHNENGPAVTTYYQNGIISRTEYWINNEKVDNL